MKPIAFRYADKTQRQEVPPVEVLSNAFLSFQEASKSLERYYRTLEIQIQDLRCELKQKDEALLENAREKEALKELAERKNRFTAMGEMVAQIVHDVRNPLGSIELFTSLLRKELAGDDDKRHITEQITFGVRTINHTLSNLLLFTQIPKPVYRELQLLPLIEESIQIVAQTAKRRKIQTVVCVPERIRFSGDEPLMKQVFLNLFLNAIQAMPKGGTLEVRASVEGEGEVGTMEILLNDTGEGIPAGNIPRVFDPFFTTRERGTGLGLTIVHNILQAHGGSILVESVMGEGSQWALRLPLQAGGTV